VAAKRLSLRCDASPRPRRCLNPCGIHFLSRHYRMSVPASGTIACRGVAHADSASLRVGSKCVGLTKIYHDNSFRPHNRRHVFTMNFVRRAGDALISGRLPPTVILPSRFLMETTYLLPTTNPPPPHILPTFYQYSCHTPTLHTPNMSTISPPPPHPASKPLATSPRLSRIEEYVLGVRLQRVNLLSCRAFR
jgi:hypothetical protein